MPLLWKKVQHHCFVQ